MTQPLPTDALFVDVPRSEVTPASIVGDPRAARRGTVGPCGVGYAAVSRQALLLALVLVLLPLHGPARAQGVCNLRFQDWTPCVGCVIDLADGRRFVGVGTPGCVQWLEVGRLDPPPVPAPPTNGRLATTKPHAVITTAKEAP